MSTHLKHDFPIDLWCRKLHGLGLKPGAIVLENLGESSDWNDANSRLNEAEIKWIAIKRSERCDLLNCTEGGGGLLGHKMSEATCARMRRSQLQRFLERTPEFEPDPSSAKTKLDIEHAPARSSKWKRNGDQSGVKNPFYGKSHSEEFKRQMREREVPQVTRDRICLSKVKRVRCLDDGLVFDSVRLASQHYNISEAAIAACARGLRKSGNAKGRRFEYA